MRSYAKSGVPEEIRKAGGEIFAITSEPQSLASEAQATWAFGFDSIGDPHHEILGTCRDRNWLDLFVNEHFGILETRDWVSHPKGHFQPGVLALTKEGRVLYRWRSRPTRENIGGAIERPTPQHVWNQTRSCLEAPSADLEDALIDANPVMDAKPVFWPLFLMFLLAHGWFLKPKPFPLDSDGKFQSSSPQNMMPRLILIGLLIVAALAYLPTIWVVAGLITWGVFVWPGVSRVHREFQNIPDGEPNET